MPRRAKGNKKPKPIKIQIGNHTFTHGKNLFEIEDSTNLYANNDFEALRLKLETDGYIFIGNVIPNTKTMAARDAMLKQANKDGSVVNTKQIPYIEGRMTKEKDGKHWQAGYCLDGITGTETNERDNIDTDAWMRIGPSKTMKDIYCGTELTSFWSKLFESKSTKVVALPKQTFCRLMGDSGTQEHADYYYFKKDTHIFSGQDGRHAINALTQYKIENNLELQTLDPNIAKQLRTVNSDSINFDTNKQNNTHNKHNKGRSSKIGKNEEKINCDDTLYCHICEKTYLKSSLDETRLKRLNKGGFGVSGEWHCPVCASKDFGIYTTWISLSTLKIPKDSILALCPKSHLLKQWDIPKPRDKQLCNDFNWKMPWVIPSYCEPGSIVIFNIKTIHASSLNQTNPKTYRVSCDTRILLSSNGIENKYKDCQINTQLIDKQVRGNPSPHPPLSIVKNQAKSKRNVNIKNIKNTTKNPHFGSDVDSDYSSNDESCEETVSGDSDCGQNENGVECKSDVESQNNENLNINMMQSGAMMTRARARKLEQMRSGLDGGSTSLKRISKSNKGGKGRNSVDTDELTDSMSDLKLHA